MFLKLRPNANANSSIGKSKVQNNSLRIIKKFQRKQRLCIVQNLKDPFQGNALRKNLLNTSLASHRDESKIFDGDK